MDCAYQTAIVARCASYPPHPGAAAAGFEGLVAQPFGPGFVLWVAAPAAPVFAVPLVWGDPLDLTAPTPPGPVELGVPTLTPPVPTAPAAA